MAVWLRQSFANVRAVGGSILHGFHGLFPSATLPSKFIRIDDLNDKNNSPGFLKQSGSGSAANINSGIFKS